MKLLSGAASASIIGSARAFAYVQHLLAGSATRPVAALDQYHPLRPLDVCPLEAIPGRPTADRLGAEADDSKIPRSSVGLGQPPARGSHFAATDSRVLIIDDQVCSDQRLVALVKLLELEGFDIEWVQSGTEGLSRALTGTHDVILLDLKLPDLPGLSVLEAIRAQDTDTPVIVITGVYLEEEHERVARALGVYDYLYKPIGVDDLAPLLWKAIRGRNAAAGALPNRAGVSHQVGSSGDPPEVPPRTDSAAKAAIVEEQNGRYGSGANQLASRWFQVLQLRLYRRFRHASEQFVATAAGQAILDYLDNARRGDALPDDLIENYLYVASWRNLRDILNSEKRRRLREELYAEAAPHVAEPPAAAFARESADLRRWIAALASNEAEKRALLLWFQDADVQQIAGTLGYSDLTAAEQRAEVKRFKDRILQRARRSRR